MSVSSGAGPKEQGSCGMEKSEAQLCLCNSCRYLCLVIQIQGHLKWGFVMGSPLLSSAPVLPGRQGAVVQHSAVLGCDQTAGRASRCSCLLHARVAEGTWALHAHNLPGDHTRGCHPGWEAEGEMRASLEMAPGGLVLICESKVFLDLCNFK